MKQQIKTGDTVSIMSGANKGKTAKVVKVAPKENLAYLEGIGLRTRHVHPTQYRKGGKRDIHVGIHMSNLAVTQKSTDKPATKKKETKK